MSGDKGRTAKKSSLLSPRRVGDLNRSRVLQALTDHGPLSRSDLARAAGVTRATMGTIVQSLIDVGILEEHDPLTRGAIGKPARPVWFAPGAGLAVAASITVGAVEACLVDAVGTLRGRLSVPFDDPTNPNLVTSAVARAVHEVRDGASPVGIGVAVPGACDTATGEVLGSGRVPGADGRRIFDQLSTTGLPVFIDNDSRAQAAAERWFGAGRGVETFASVQTGDGLGVGLVLDNAIIRSRHGSAGEVGHTCVVPDGDPCDCGLRGCWETIASLRWLRREAQAAGLPNASATTCEQVMALADHSAEAADLAERYAANLSVGLANLNQVLSLEVFILHGDALGGGEAFRRMLERNARARSLSRLSVVHSPLGADATLLGASALVLSETFRLVA
ncbi:MAG: ROK family transcriptional regulator [Acidimicrobiales bacterium]|nr:ROK family transcriptional regulator [Acidimicrobiales bacterium]